MYDPPHMIFCPVQAIQDLLFSKVRTLSDWGGAGRKATHFLGVFFKNTCPAATTWNVVVTSVLFGPETYHVLCPYTPKIPKNSKFAILHLFVYLFSFIYNSLRATRRAMAAEGFIYPCPALDRKDQS